jgi:hypothetical protein
MNENRESINKSVVEENMSQYLNKNDRFAARMSASMRSSTAKRSSAAED